MRQVLHCSWRSRYYPQLFPYFSATSQQTEWDCRTPTLESQSLFCSIPARWGLLLLGTLPSRRTWLSCLNWGYRCRGWRYHWLLANRLSISKAALSMAGRRDWFFYPLRPWVYNPGYFLEWNDFPYPPSLKRDGRYYGEIWMTVAFAPTRGARWGTEYCETHIDTSLGVYYEQISRKTGEVQTKFRGLVPPEHKNPGVLYESYQVAQLRKLAPVRTYHGKMGDRGKRGLRWRLKLKLLTRHGIDTEWAHMGDFGLPLLVWQQQRRVRA